MSGPLRRVLGFWDSVALSVGIVVGVGIFRVSAEVAGLVAQPWMILAVWIVGGFITLIGALCYAELASAHPETGGDYVYLKKGLGGLTAFLFGWSELIIIRTGSIASVALVFGEHFASFFGAGRTWVKPAGCLALASLAVLNILSLRFTSKIQDIATAAKLIALSGLVGFGLASGKGDWSHFSAPAQEPAAPVILAFTLALIPVLWTYGGWHESVFVAGETRQPAKTIPRALLATVFSVGLVYVLMNALYLYLMAPGRMAESDLVAFDAFKILLGGNARRLFEILIIIYAFGCLNAMLTTGSRITYALAQDHRLFKALGSAHSRFGTPVRSIAAVAVCSAAYIAAGTFEKLLFFTGIAYWLFFTCVIATVFVFRRRWGAAALPFRTPLYPLVPLAAMAFGILLFFNTLIQLPWQSAIGLGIIASGVPVYFFAKDARPRTQDEF